MEATRHHPAPGREAGPTACRARLMPGTTVRREPFGGLVYSFHTRQLRIVRSRPAIEVVIHVGAGESFEDVSTWLVQEGHSSDLDAARRFVIATVERFRELEVMSWITS